MKKLIALPSRDGNVDSHFGHCEYFTVVTVDTDSRTILNMTRVESAEGCGCKSGIASDLQKMGVTLMLSGNMGDGATNKLSSVGIEVIRGCSGSIENVVKSYLDGTLHPEDVRCDHSDCHHHDDDSKTKAPAGGFRIKV